MKDSSHLHGAKVEKPIIYDKLSELVIVYTSDGIITTAQWGIDGQWHGEGDNTFGNVEWWYDGFPIPHDFRIDYARYGGEV